jgi:hypothetical protein
MHPKERCIYTHNYPTKETLHHQPSLIFIEREREMASSRDSPPNLSFAIRGTTTTQNKFSRSISTKEASFSNFPYTPPHLSGPAVLSKSLHTSPLSSPLHSSHTPTKLTDVPSSAYRCISSVLKKDGQILSIAVSNGFAYTGSDTNMVRIWRLPEFTECGQLKTKACMVVALQVSNERVYAAYGDAKIRVWRRTWDGAWKHIRLATIPTTGSFVRSYIAGKDKMVMVHQFYFINLHLWLYLFYCRC